MPVAEREASSSRCASKTSGDMWIVGPPSARSDAANAKLPLGSACTNASSADKPEREPSLAPVT